MQPRIIPFDPGKEFYIDEGCFVVELTTPDADTALSIARCRVEPGKTTQWHRLSGTIERYVIEHGEGRVEVGDLPAAIVRPGDVVVIPAACRQRITNTGAVDLVFLALCTPRFSPAIYEALPEDACDSGV